MREPGGYPGGCAADRSAIFAQLSNCSVHRGEFTMPSDQDRAHEGTGPDDASPWAAPAADQAANPFAPPAADQAANPFAPPGADPSANPFAPPAADQAANPFAPPAADPYGPGPYAPGAPSPYAPPAAYGQAGPWSYGYPGGPGYWPQQPPSGTNGYAITSLVLGILGFVCVAWMAGLGFGIAALRHIKRTGQRGRGLAVAGIVLSSLWGLLLGSAVVLGAINGDRDTSAGAGWSGGTVPVTELATGDCFRWKTSRSNTSGVKRMPCNDSHYGEVFWTVPLGGGSYPGDAKLAAESNRGCRERENDYAMDTWAEPTSVTVRFSRPDSDSWRTEGGNRVTCYLVDSKGERSGSLRKDRSNLTTEQYDYLRAANTFDDAWNSGPDEDLEVSDAPEDYRAWAEQLNSSLGFETAVLEHAAWGAPAKQPVADLLAELRAMQPHLQAAHKAADAATVENELDEAFRHFGRKQTKTVRAALGLATVDPYDYEDGDGDGPRPDGSGSPGPKAVVDRTPVPGRVRQA